MIDVLLDFYPLNLLSAAWGFKEVLFDRCFLKLLTSTSKYELKVSQDRKHY